MTHALHGERTLMRIAVSSADEYQGKQVYRAIVDLLLARGFAGTTVLPCIMGFGARRRLYSELNEITSIGMPVIIEAVESEEKIGSVLPELDRMLTGGVITLERAHVLLYRAPEARPDQTPPDTPASEV